ncbi:branched-chain amino acid transport system II carrier protein [Sinobaca sp. H24]|uniref:branched-chain amino acid transport system II carrier protein n=1 Tax=Sinobaca sp. H24 TaxID=2923376 RepID=UPI00207A948B|nr:branched-chain amino acid transport system II carrier protein [Sinobaca sp. H24]
MNKLTWKDNFFIGLMLFALFFGAGNLIFPPFLGQEAGTSYLPAIIGFVITGVGLPVLGIIAVSLSGQSFQGIAERVNKPFALLFMIILYASIGPFFGIPRAANVSYEMGIVPLLPENGSNMALFLFSLLFFGLVFLLSLNPNKLVTTIGYVITPALLLSIILLVAGAYVTGFMGGGGPPSNEYASQAIGRGFVEGYLTMDTIAALAFGLIVVNTLKEKGALDRREVRRSAASAGIIAGIGLAAVYIAIGWLGVHSGPRMLMENGSEILTYSAGESFGFTGTILLGLIVTLACLTTCIGLVTACSQYFHRYLSFLPYSVLALLLTVLSLLVGNLGLNTIISLSVPLLVAIYPLAIVLILMALLNEKITLHRSHYIGAIAGTIVVSAYDGLKEAGLVPIEGVGLYSLLPFFELNLGWILPALIGFVIGHCFRSKSISY